MKVVDSRIDHRVSPSSRPDTENNFSYETIPYATLEVQSYNSQPQLVRLPILVAYSRFVGQQGIEVAETKILLEPSVFEQLSAYEFGLQQSILDCQDSSRCDDDATHQRLRNDPRYSSIAESTQLFRKVWCQLPAGIRCGLNQAPSEHVHPSLLQACDLFVGKRTVVD